MTRSVESRVVWGWALSGGLGGPWELMDIQLLFHQEVMYMELSYHQELMDIMAILAIIPTGITLAT